MKLSWRKLLILPILFVITTSSLFGQSRTYLGAGAGIPEFYHLQASQRFDKWRWGVHLGTVFGEETISVGVFGARHFGGSSAHSDLKPWYYNIGLTYTAEESPRAITNDGWLGFRVGRQNNFNERSGISVELGMIRNIYHWRRVTDSGGWNFDFDFKYLPSGSLVLYYRL